MIPVVMGVMLVIFTLTYITEGDPAVTILGMQADEESVNALRAEMGLDDPFLVQFTRFVTNTAQLNLGTTFNTRRPVWDEIATRFPITMQLSLISMMIAVVVGIPLGILSATKQYSVFDAGATFIGLLGVSIPNFWLGMMLIIMFSLNFGLFPPSGWESPIHWVLPSLTLGISSTAIIMRMTRSSMLEVIRQDYIRTARAKGQRESVVIYRHALKNALMPVVTVVGLQFGLLLSGAILTETIFSINGVGRFMVEAITMRDFPIIHGGVLLLALTFSFVNLAVDILYAFVDPRIRSQYR